MVQESEPETLVQESEPAEVADPAAEATEATEATLATGGLEAYRFLRNFLKKS